MGAISAAKNPPSRPSPVVTEEGVSPPGYQHLCADDWENGELQHHKKNAAWYYPEPKDAARQITGRVAFWKGVEVVA